MRKEDTWKFVASVTIGVLVLIGLLLAFEPDRFVGVFEPPATAGKEFTVCFEENDSISTDIAYTTQNERTRRCLS